MPGEARVDRRTCLLVGATLLGARGVHQERKLGVRFVATPQAVVPRMLRLAGVTAADVVYDLGCGDGRAVITAAALFGAGGVGVDMDADRIAESRQNAHRLGLEERVAFRCEDLFRVDLGGASVVFLYLSPEMNLELRPKLLRELRPGARVVSHEFDMGDWTPDGAGTVLDAALHYGAQAPIRKSVTFYAWTVPSCVVGTWRWRTGVRAFALHLARDFQNVRAVATVDGRDVEVVQPRLDGDMLSFGLEEGEGAAPPSWFVGRVEREHLLGLVELHTEGTSHLQAWRATRSG